MKVVVAGGGIGGLALALACARRGSEVVVLERRSEFTEAGAGIQLAPNAFHALDILGVGDAVRDAAVNIVELRLMDGTTGQSVASMSLNGEYLTRFGNPYVVVHRLDLYRPLLEACRAMGSVELRTGAMVVGYVQEGGEATAILQSGERIHGDALIGADGIRSVVRSQLIGDGEPKVSGHTIYRSVIPMGKVPEAIRSNSVTLWAGPGWHFVHYPIAGGRYLNLAATHDNSAREVVVGVSVKRSIVMASFQRICASAREILDLGQGWKSWVLCDRDPVNDWTDGRVALLGDAAHPMLQYAAQGACMALEDAVILAELLDECKDDVALILRKYNRARRERSAKAQVVARAIGTHLYHPAGPEAERRNAMLASLTQADLHDKVDWLHGMRAFGGGPNSDRTSLMT